MIDGRTYFANSNGDILNAEGKKLTMKYCPAKHVSKPNMHGAYPQVNIAGRAHIIHRLVCTAFWGKPLPGQECHHLNGNKFDNRPSNLIWLTKPLHLRFDRAVKEGCIYIHQDPNDIIEWEMSHHVEN